jgi:regulator of protease activity HflC (stomatin/prohibitin superfamily)
VDVSAVAYYKVVDPIKSIVAIENVMSAINQISQTSMRNIVGKFQLDEILSERETINQEITKVLDTHTESWGVVVTVVEIKDIELPEGMQRAMAKQAEAEREKRAKIISAEGEFLSSQKLADTADIMAAHPIALQLRNLQTMAEISVEKNSTIIFPAQFMSTVSDIQKFMQQEGMTVKK